MIAQKLSLKRENQASGFKKWMVYSLCFGLVFLGLPMDRILLAEEGAVHRIVIDQTFGPNPDPGGFRVGENLQFKAIVLDEKGYAIDPGGPACGGIVFEIPKTVAGQVLISPYGELPISPGPGGIPRVGQTNPVPIKNGILPVTVGGNKGGQHIEAYCKNQPKIKGEKIVTGSGGAAVAKDSFDRPPLAREFTPPPSPAKEELKDAVKDTPPAQKSSGNGATLAIVGGVVAGAAIIAGVAAAGAGGGGGGGGGGGSSSNCRCSSGSYYCSGSWGTACCSHATCSSPYYASNGLCYCSIFSMPSNVRYVMCGGCKERTE
jgi:hypothetical protein